MHRRVTATFLLAYLAWAVFGSVFAGEHVHHESDGTVVHSHAFDSDHRFHHHENDSDNNDQSDDTDKTEARPDGSAATPVFAAPPHRADSLLALIGRALTHFRGDLLSAPNSTPIGWYGRVPLLQKPRQSYSMRIRDGTDHARDTLTRDPGQFPRPPPLSV